MNATINFGRKKLQSFKKQKGYFTAGVAFFKPPLPKPLYGYDFLSGSAAPIYGNKALTLTRSTTATYFDSNGNIQLAAINGLRFDYDPATLNLRGVLLETQRTNLLRNSKIDGTNLATQTISVTNGGVYALSFYGTGTITLSGAATAVVAGGGAFPQRTVYPITAAGTSLTLTVTGTVQFAQCEARSALEAAFAQPASATSFIPTAASAVTRAADYYRGAIDPITSFTFCVEHLIRGNAGNAPLCLDKAAQLAANPQYVFQFFPSLCAGTYSRVGVSAASVGPVTSPAQGVFKLALAADNVDVTMISSDGSLSTVSTGSAISQNDLLQIGNASTSFVLDGWVRHVSVYPNKLPIGQLKEITK